MTVDAAAKKAVKRDAAIQLEFFADHELPNAVRKALDQLGEHLGEVDAWEVALLEEVELLSF